MADEKTEGVGVRYDQGKIRVELVPPELVIAFAEVAAAGAKKYPERNWELGMKRSRVYASLVRHLLKWWSGQDTDAETGCRHLDMVVWNVGVLATYNRRGVGEDDRPRTPGCTGWLEKEEVRE